MDIQGKVAIITGGASGIGRATALRLASEGASIVVADVDDAGARETVALIEADGGTAADVHCDVTNSSDLQAMFDFARDTYGGFDILYNNAGIGTGLPRWPDCSEEQWVRTMQVDLLAVMEGTRRAIPLLRERGGGVIISTASLAGLFGYATDPVYCAAKHGVVGMTRSLAGLKQQANIRVNCVCPAVVNTPMLTRGLKNLSGEALEQAEKALAAMPMVPAEDVAQGVVELIEDEEAVGYAMGISLNQPHRIVPAPINLPLTSGDPSAPRQK